MRPACLTIDQLEKLVREGTVVGAEGADFDAHLRECSRCRTRLAEMREADAFIAGIAQRMPDGADDAIGSGGPNGSGVARGLRSARHARADDVRPPSMRDDFPGYAVEAIVDIGGQGAIYKARQLATNRLVAIKVPLGDAVRQASRRYRFRREIELTSRLDHPGIVRIFGVCEAPDGRIGCVMEFVEGQRFDEWAEARRGSGKEGGRDGVRQIVTAAAKIAEAIAYAHQRGVLHRDLKPSNVLVTVEGLPRVLDFGLAKALDGGSGAIAANSFVTATGAFLGTLAFAAPEQVDGRRDETDVRTDVYGIGLVLYHALAGRVPWDAEAAPPELCAQIRRGDAPRPTPIHGAPDAELDAIVLKAIATEMDRRYPSAAILAEDLDRWLTGRPVRARFDSRWYVVRKTAWRKRWWIAAATVAICLLGTMATLGLRAQSVSRQAALDKAVHNARELESHWSSIADARATARDDFTFGEQKVWDVLLNATEAAEQGGIEDVAALGHRFRAHATHTPRDAPTPTDWSQEVPTSPAFWALTEIYLRTPVVASLPELLLQATAVVDSVTDQILIGRARAIERWDWRTGRVVGRIELPFPDGDVASLVLASKGWAAVRSSAGALALIDLERNRVSTLPTKSDLTPVMAGPHLVCVDAALDRRHVEVWHVEGDSPQLLWSRDLAVRVSYAAIDGGEHFLAVLSEAGDLLVLELSSGLELLRRGREEVPRYRWIGSRGRSGEVLAWGDGLPAILEWSQSAVSLKATLDQPEVDGEGVHRFASGSPRGTYVAKLDRRGIAVGQVDQMVRECRTIPALRGEPRGLSANDQHLHVDLTDGARHAIVDLGTTGIVQLTSPADLADEHVSTIFAVGFVETGTSRGAGVETMLSTASMDGALRRYAATPKVSQGKGTDRAGAASASLAANAAASRSGVAVASPESVRSNVSSHGLSCFAVDGDWTYVGTHERGLGDARLFRLREGASELLLDDGRSWYCGIVLEQGRNLWALGGDGRIFRMNIETSVVEAERALLPNRAFRAIARMAHRQLLIAGSGHPALHLLDETSLEPLAPIVPMSPVRDIVVSPTDPDLFVTTHETGVIRIWRVTGGPTSRRESSAGDGADNDRSTAVNEPMNEPLTVEFVREMGAHAGPVFCAAFHPSGRILATGGGSSETRELRLWDLDLGHELAAFSLFDQGVFSVAFSPDGRWLAAGGEPVPGRYAEGGQAFLIDLTAGERSIAGNLEFHIARLKSASRGTIPAHAEMLRRRFGGEGPGAVGVDGGD